MSFTPQDQKKGSAWDIPAKYQKMKNTTKADDASLLKIGKMMWAKHCKSCHGSEGKGEGPKAKMLKTSIVDFTAKDFKSNADGSLYFKSFVGRDEMPNFEKKITSEEDRWAIINYIKTL
jgi:mono/diheme cytochrome c family protein